ncbi:hypothetical protein D3OALGA1CA_1025 [Olavius algarvensis associated proteobacterium Delta 3]|nr:hypothetical protein D3OALGA1CA_1025 [Olavius algarvensis associated proteobacterium Delta 3]CAB5130756.1 hypothetical protein D3OALGB2SA_3615 [Olavius algarvensis associated proteobacterium Delta 3]
MGIRKSPIMSGDRLDHIPSDFIRAQVTRLLRRFSISYRRTDDTTQYIITSRRTGRQVSYAIVFLHDRKAKRLHISKFFPELMRRENSKYLSAACFVLLVQHFSQHMVSEPCHQISLKTQARIFDAFYARLRDFHFEIWKNRGGDTVELRSGCAHLPMDTMMIHSAG